MNLNSLFITIALLFTGTIIAQQEDNVLLAIDNEQVFTSEFIRIYNKNKDIVIDKEKKDFAEYLKLFVDYKLKLKEARDLKLDTIVKYKQELIKYREQLIEPYLQNPDALERLTKQAYDRMLYEINANHILIRLSPDAIPADSLKAYNKIIEARNKILNGESFEEIAKKYSEDPSAKKNGGNLGYFTVFQMVYPFENMAYNTSVGEISKPFKSQFGYHILKVNDKRKSRGEVEVAHIMIKNNPEDSLVSKNKIFDIYNKLEQNGDFSKIAKEHSDDKGSAVKGGLLPKFGSGRMIKSFETAAFSLQNIGDYSKPFKTNYGWHILKLIKKYPVKNYEELKPYLEGKIKSGNRAFLVESDLAKKVSKNYIINEDKDLLQLILNKSNTKGKENKVLLQVNEDSIVVNDFNNFIIKKRNKSLNELYSEFKNEKIIDYYKNHLEETNKEFKNIYQEYQDGLLLFELLQKKIWERSEKDSIGLQHFFDKNRKDYVWKKRGELIIASCTNIDKATLVKQYLEKNKATEEIKELVNQGATIHVLFSKGILEEDSPKLPDNYILKVGVSEIISENKNQFTIIKVNKIIPPKNKLLKETKGEVMNDFQQYLEEQWVSELRKKYTIQFNKKELKKLKKKIDR